MNLTEDLTENWIAETNEAPRGQAEDWQPAWETWFVESDEEADKIERDYAQRGEKYLMKPRPFINLLEKLKEIRPDRGDWGDYRFRNVHSGVIILACIL